MIYPSPNTHYPLINCDEPKFDTNPIVTHRLIKILQI